MTPQALELAKWIIGLIAGGLGTVFLAIGFLLRISFKLGADAEKIATGLGDLKDIKAKTEKIPTIDVRVQHLERHAFHNGANGAIGE